MEVDVEMKMTSKKQYTAPCCDLAVGSAEDIVTLSLTLFEEGDGEWLDWAEMNRSR